MRGSDIAVRMAMIALVVEAAFLLGFFFPPPSAFALALTRQNRPRAGFTTNGNKSALVQAVRLQAPAVGTPSKMESSGRISTAMAVNSSLVFISFSNVQPSTRQGRRGSGPGEKLEGARSGRQGQAESEPQSTGKEMEIEIKETVDEKTAAAKAAPNGIQPHPAREPDEESAEGKAQEKQYGSHDQAADGARLMTESDRYSPRCG